MAVLNSVKAILQSAADAGATDVHLCAGSDPQMRVQGKLKEIGGLRLQAADTLDILVNMMNDAQRERFEEKGEYELAIPIFEGLRCRVSAYKQMGNVSLAFRLISSRLPSLESLDASGALLKIAGMKSGLVLVAGTLGSGKSTTLASLVNRINKGRAAHIITLESPVEYVHRHDKSLVEQREVGSDTGSYAVALRAALREDPDVIAVDDLRDKDTICAALEAAEAGCLILAAIVASGANSALDALLNRFSAEQRVQVRGRLSTTLHAVVVQKRRNLEDGASEIYCETMQVGQQTRNALKNGGQKTS
ncbi:MAG: Flp pilus assembly complex ATPase component TadA [Candidatus Gastranaerophilales bacterium]|nr:Flp pilus assembly complex ATPase component TadA [Candidatus Gastranaerophilales bacterium]